MIIRNLQKSIQEKIGKGKTILLLGARQVGKSTLLRNLFEDEKNILWLDAENPDIPELFKNATNTSLTRQFSNYKIVIIDEAQKIENIGSVLKLFTDYLKNTQEIATGLFL